MQGAAYRQKHQDYWFRSHVLCRSPACSAATVTWRLRDYPGWPGPRRGPRDDLGQRLSHDHDRVIGHDQGELAGWVTPSRSAARHAALVQQLAQRHEQVKVEIGQVSDGTRHGGTI
jgi:hypothetical protein